ncbi:MAG: hypothetical protein JSU91_00280 [Thermoplasmatales archaeon]|nr:MAG: hypothetical protein JSU91_00280 [Thermoplasmatales archaeon]
MDKKRGLFCKTLIVLIIILFITMSFTPVIYGDKRINNSISLNTDIEENNILNSQPAGKYYETIDNSQKSFGSYPYGCDYVYFLYPPRELEWEYNNEYFNGTINQFRLLATDNTNHTWDLNNFELHINGMNCSNPDAQSFYRRCGFYYEWEIIWNNLSENCTGVILFEILYLDCLWIEWYEDFDNDGDEAFHYSHFNPRSYINGELDGAYVFDSDKAYIVWYTPTNYNPPDVPSKPSGNTSGYICIDHNYSTSTADPNGLNVSYGWDWNGDFEVDEWTDWYNSNETCVIAHNWSNPDEYSISVMAKNTLEEKSNWSSQLNVTMLNHPPYSPSNPHPFDGDTNVPVTEVLCWTGGDPDICDNVVYDVYFGPNPDPPLVSSHQTYTCYDPYGELPIFEDFYWRVVAWDNHGASNSSPEWTFSTGINPPPTDPEIDGPSSGRQGIDYEFTFVSTDPDNQTIKYYVDWGDGKITETKHFLSGKVVTLNHTWNEEGTYLIKAKAIDEYDLESNWSEFEVIIPRNRAIFNTLLQLLLEHFPILERILLLIKVF